MINEDSSACNKSKQIKHIIADINPIQINLNKSKQIKNIITDINFICTLNPQKHLFFGQNVF